MCIRWGDVDAPSQDGLTVLRVRRRQGTYPGEDLGQITRHPRGQVLDDEERRRQIRRKPPEQDFQSFDSTGRSAYHDDVMPGDVRYVWSLHRSPSAGRPARSTPEAYFLVYGGPTPASVRAALIFLSEIGGCSCQKVTTSPPGGDPVQGHRCSAAISSRAWPVGAGGGCRMFGSAPSRQVGCPPH